MKSTYLWLLRLYVHYFVAADRREKCPCCGLRQLHPMKFDPESKKVLHMCRTLHVPETSVIGCGAVWGIEPLVNAANWEVAMQSSDGEASTPDSKFSPAQREPIIIRTETKEKAS